MFWKEKPGVRRAQYKRVVGNEVVGWAKALGLTKIDPFQKKYRKYR